MKICSAEIEIFRYSLVSAGPLNAKTVRNVSEGVLLKFRNAYADLHPWPELGDAALDVQLQCLRVGQATPLLDAAFQCLNVDREGRNEKRSLFDQVMIPLNHATVVPASLDSLYAARDLGFTKAKVKASGPDLEKLRLILEETPMPLRIDFNGTGSLDRLGQFFGSLSAAAVGQVDFLEDPFPYDPHTWAQLHASTGCRLALDRYDLPLKSQSGIDYLILKPAAQPDVFDRAQWAVERQIPIVVTSAMDHPLGQTYAAFIATQIEKRWPGSLDLCGLATHLMFRKSAFSERLGAGPHLTVPDGTGLGFDDLLADLPWEKLQ